MSDTLFLQFFNQTKSGYFDLCNGFSDTYDLCKSKGDFYLTEHEIDRTKWYLDETYENRPLPINRGTVYISAIYMNHLYQSYVWAKQYPDIRFVVGGPIAAERHIGRNRWHPLYVKVDNDDMLPPNLKITGQSVEDWFGVPNFSGKWRVDVPEFVPDDSRIYFSYTLDNGCYWRKCVFCNIALNAREVFRKRKDMNYEFKDMEHKGRKIVRLNTGSITTKYIKEVLPEVPRGNDIEYRLFVRPAKAENAALRQVLSEFGGKIPKLVLGFGMEFPTNRMLEYIGKGCSTNELLEFLQICHENNIHINANFILGWDNLIEDDIVELEKFMGSMPENSITTFQMRWLFAHPHTKVHDTCKGRAVKLGPFYEGFRTEINERQLELNKEAGDIINRYSSIKNYKLEGMVNIRKYL